MTSVITTMISMFGTNATTLKSWQTLLILVLIFAVYLAIYLLRSIGLYVLAKRQGVNKAYLAWIPGVWLFVVCKLLGNARIFNQPVQSLAVLMCVVFSISEFLTFVYGFLLYFPLVEYAVFGGQNLYIGTYSQFGNSLISYISLDNTTAIFVEKQIYPFGLNISTLDKILDGVSTVSLLFDLASIFITVSLYFALFRKYWPQHYMLVSLLSIFLGLFPIFAFVIRKKNPVDFNEYMRSRYGAYQNPYRNPYGNPYGNNYGNNYGNGYGSSYGAPSRPSIPQEPDSPFEEFEDKKNRKPKEPFEEFEEKKKKDNKSPFDEFDN